MNLNKAKGALIGLAIGDALGTTIEFSERDSREVLTTIVGGGPFQLPAGYWTDDTSLALCLGHSLVQNGFDIVDQLNKYLDWRIDGYMSSTGQCFDIGGATKTALTNFYKNKQLYNNDDFMSCGNGSLMRLAPIPIYYNTPEAYTQEFVDLIKYSALSSVTTHAYVTCRDACVAYAIMINRAINSYSKDYVLDMSMVSDFGITDPSILEVLDGSYIGANRDDISSSGYVVDSLEAALWAFHSTDNFKDAVLLAANLGDDADTVAAITGQLAGAFYGLENIPKEWVELIYMNKEILQLAEDLHKKD